MIDSAHFFDERRPADSTPAPLIVVGGLHGFARKGVTFLPVAINGHRSVTLREASQIWRTFKHLAGSRTDPRRQNDLPEKDGFATLSVLCNITIFLNIANNYQITPLQLSNLAILMTCASKRLKYKANFLWRRFCTVTGRCCAFFLGERPGGEKESMGARGFSFYQPLVQKR